MFKSCPRCGKIHDFNYKCNYNKPKFNSTKYGTAEERKLRNTTAWHKKSEQVREDAKHLCEVCRSEGRYNFENIEVHHIIKVREDKTRLLDESNLVCLCARHHKQADAGKIDKEYLTELGRRRQHADIPPTVGGKNF